MEETNLAAELTKIVDAMVSAGVPLVVSDRTALPDWHIRYIEDELALNKINNLFFYVVTLGFLEMWFDIEGNFIGQLSGDEQPFYEGRVE